MTRKIGILLLIVVMLFTAGFDLVFEPDESEMTDPNTEEVSYEDYTDEYAEDAIEDPQGEEPPAEMPPAEMPPAEEPPAEIPPAEIPPTEVPPTEVPPTEIPPTPEPELPSWLDIDEDQVDILNLVYWQMTNTGRLYSGWFEDGDYAPCTWPGITCENRHVVKLSFENAGYFTTFPDQVLQFRDLKELRMIDTLVFGPLPETLFMDLPKLEKLELKGNFFTDVIPDLPAAFEVYPMLQTIVISDNIEDDRKAELLFHPEYSETAGFEPDPQDYPDIDLTPGLDGSLPADWNRLPLLSKVDLSKNNLEGNIPDSFGQIPLAELDLSGNGTGLQVSKSLYDYWGSFANPKIVLDGLNPPAEVIPTEIPPAEPPAPEEPPVQPAGPAGNPPEPPAQPTQAVITDVPTEVPTTAPTAEPTKKSSKKRKKATATPAPKVIVVTATPAPEWYFPPQPYQQPEYQQPYYYPTATPYTYTNPYWQYPAATPYDYNYSNPSWQYPTATPYNYNYSNPSWLYPTATNVYSYPQYVQTPEPTQDPASMLGFTYQTAEMTGNNIPMTWRYTGMTQYSINYLDANDELYPQFAMEWKPASELCNASVCNASVQDIPQELLNGGTFSLQLRAQDGAGRTYISDPVRMQVSAPQTAPDTVPTPEPEPQRGFWSGFFHWLFGPLIRLFGGS